MTDTQEMATARLIAGSSPDPSTKIGATIISDGLVLGVGFNRLKPGIVDTPALWRNRPVKLASVVHAEEVALNDARCRGSHVIGATMYVWGLPPCDDCARQIAEAGIAKVVYTYAKPHRELNPYWRTRCHSALVLLKRLGVKCVRLGKRRVDENKG